MSLQGDDVSWYGSKNVSSGWIYGKLSTLILSFRRGESN
jgi:hypothetical protein